MTEAENELATAVEKLSKIEFERLQGIAISGAEPNPLKAHLENQGQGKFEESPSHAARAILDILDPTSTDDKETIHTELVESGLTSVVAEKLNMPAPRLEQAIETALNSQKNTSSLLQDTLDAIEKILDPNDETPKSDLMRDVVFSNLMEADFGIARVATEMGLTPKELLEEIHSSCEAQRTNEKEERVMAPPEEAVQGRNSVRTATELPPPEAPLSR